MKNLLLQGFENWSLQQDLLCCLEVFLHCSIWRILHISIIDVQEQHLQNKKVCPMFYNIPCVKNIIAARQLGFLGKLSGGLLNACPLHAHCLLPAQKCNLGRPYLHNKDVNVCNLQLLFAKVPEVIIDDIGSVKDWFQVVLHESYCDTTRPMPP